MFILIKYSYFSRVELRRWRLQIVSGFAKLAPLNRFHGGLGGFCARKNVVCPQTCISLLSNTQEWGSQDATNLLLLQGSDFIFLSLLWKVLCALYSWTVFSSEALRRFCRLNLMNLCSPSARKRGIVSISLFELFETKIIECEEYKINLAHFLKG